MAQIRKAKQQNTLEFEEQAGQETRRRLLEFRNKTKNVLNDQELRKVKGLIPGLGAFVLSMHVFPLGIGG